MNGDDVIHFGTVKKIGVAVKSGWGLYIISMLVLNK